MLIQPTTTYQAYNLWGGYDLYYGPRHRHAWRARVVSFDRPYQRKDGAADFFAKEQPLVSYAEWLGLPLAYLSSVDLDRGPHRGQLPEPARGSPVRHRQRPGDRQLAGPSRR